MTAEKGEHERAPPLCVSYPAPLRATLRAPPSKWAIGAFFPESPCRMLSLVLSFASKESTIPRRGGSPITRAAVGASGPVGKSCAPAGAPKGFPLALWKPSGPEGGEIFPIGLQAPLPAPTAARQTPPAEGLRLRAHQRAFLGANNRRGSHCRALRLLFA